MKPQKAKELKRKLETVHLQFLDEQRVLSDAIAPSLKYHSARDREFAAFLCAVLAYGKVALIQKNARRLLEPMGPSPVQWLLKSSISDLQKLTNNWCHRFNTADDMLLFLSLLKQIYHSTNSLEHFLEVCPSDEPFGLFCRFHEKIVTLSPAPFDKFPEKGNSSFWFLLPDPRSGSACKRLNLFLRWMVGESEMDHHLWKSFKKQNLLIPVDTHVLRQAQALKLTKRKVADWKTAVEITEKLKFLDPQDPTRFDFALCHIGMKGLGGTLEPRYERNFQNGS